MKKPHKIALSFLSGIILSLGWYESGSGLFLLVGFIPLLLLEDQIIYDSNKKKKSSSVFLYASLAFLTWNLIATWWIKNASFAGMIAAVIVSSFFMSVPFWFYSITKRTWGRYIGYISLVIYWLAYEFSYTHGEISWPWLTLGNGFAFDIILIQWYEYTGVFGGTLWVLTVNIFLYELIRRKIAGESIRVNYGLLAISAVIIIFPVFFSVIRYYNYKEKIDPREIVIVQPNIDPYMKFNDIPSIKQTQIQLLLAEKLVTPATDYVASPETSINHNIWIDQLQNVPDIIMIKDMVMQYPGLKYITGITCYQQYNEWERTKTSKHLTGSNMYYDSFNSAIQIDSTGNIPIYHKSKLVVGVEKMPYPGMLKILQPLTIRLGGTFRSHGTQKDRSIFSSADGSVKIAPVICYESVYGEYLAEYIKKGANMIFVITNDGWWGNTPGYRQHNALSRIRAVETRRSIARSANTGISCFINQRGDILDKLNWWQRSAIKNKLNINDKLTFYVLHGDYIARNSFYLAVIMLMSVLAKRAISRYQQ
jgi:apolipoprotein N-acyltransferase